MRRIVVLALALLVPPSGALPASYEVPEGLPEPEHVLEGGFVVAIEFAKDGSVVWAELDGAVRMLPPGAADDVKLYEVPALRGPEWGVTGLALAPDFVDSRTLWVVYTTGPPGTDPSREDVSGEMRLSRLDASGETILYTIEATRSHNSGRVLYHDGTLFLSNGEHTQGSGPTANKMRAQDKGDINGKILRMTLDGKPAAGNPYETDPAFEPYVYSMGHRNPFGLAWDETRDRLVMSDPGPDCCEEVNAIVPGGNYGWPVCKSVCEPAREGIEQPLVDYPQVVTPVGLAVVGREYFLGGYNTNEVRRIYETPAGWTDEVVGLVEAGLLEVEASPDGKTLWFGTWNGLWRMPTPAPRGDAPPLQEEPPVEEPPVGGPPVDEPPANETPRESMPPVVGKGVPLPALVAVLAFALAARRRC